MNVKDRVVLLKRCLGVIFNPKAESVILIASDKAEHVIEKIYAGNIIEARRIYINHFTGLFTKHSNNSIEINDSISGFVLQIQNEWNKKHPNDKICIITEKED